MSDSDSFNRSLVHRSNWSFKHLWVHPAMITGTSGCSAIPGSICPNQGYHSILKLCLKSANTQVLRLFYPGFCRQQAFCNFGSYRVTLKMQNQFNTYPRFETQARIRISCRPRRPGSSLATRLRNMCSMPRTWPAWCPRTGSKT